MDRAKIRLIESSELDILRGLWDALFEHHAGLGAMPPVRTADEGWDIRRETYRKWLAAGDTSIFVASVAGVADPTGYASVRTGDGSPTWRMGERVAELETLAVLPAFRGSGIGGALVAAARAAAAEAGAETLLVSVAHSNDPALGFYERAGFKPFYVDLMLPTGEEQ